MPCTRRASGRPRARRWPSTSTHSAPPNGSCSSTSSTTPGCTPRPAQVLQRGAVLVADPVHPEELAGGRAGQRRRPVLDVIAEGGRDRIAVRVTPRMAEGRVDPLDQQVADRVLQRLRLVVHLIPGHPGRLDQKGLDQPVPADHFPGVTLAVLVQHDAAGPRAGQQARRCEPAQHRRHRGRGDAQPGGHVRSRDPGRLEAQQVDNPQILPHGLRVPHVAAGGGPARRRVHVLHLSTRPHVL